MPSSKLLNEPDFVVGGFINPSKIVGITVSSTDFDTVLDSNGNITSISIKVNRINALIQNYLTANGYVPAP